MINSGYREGLYYQDNFHISTSEVETPIRALLGENHGVGILGGHPGSDFPIDLVSELTVRMLGYDSPEEFETATGNCMAGLVSNWEAVKTALSAPECTLEMYLKGKNKNLWVRIVKRNVTIPTGEELWLASVCDMDALYQKGLLVNRMAVENHRQELSYQAELETANAELEKQKQALELALAQSEHNNEVISAISKIYWLIYQLDLLTGTFEEISVNEGQHHVTGDRGITRDRFPDACRKTIAPEYIDTMLTFLDETTLADRLSDREQISRTYQAVSGNWHLGRFIVQKRDQAGRAVKVLYTVQIINEQKRQELEYEKRLAGIAEEAQRASLSKTDFLRRMSHDIRTPINGIRGMIEIANHYADDLQKQRECRNKVWEASGYLLSLVNSVLDMNKLESGAVLLANVPFDLYQLLAETNAVAEMQAMESGIHYVIDTEKQHIEHPYLIGSPSHIKQVLLNLASNAVKYNKENGTVTVFCREVTQKDDTAIFRFVCSDTGIGMSEEFQKRVFEPFSQEEQVNARTHYDGFGLGLSIVKGLVGQMGGNIDFVSKEGIGTTFVVTLPFRIAEAPEKAPEQVPVEAVDLHGKRILLAEDNDLNLEIAQFFLEQQGAEVTVAKNGKTATELFAASAPGDIDLILMDIMMPVMNGYTATEAIRNMDRPDAKTVPIIAMSANAFQDDIQKSLSVGMNDHLPKPLTTEKLLSTVAGFVQKKPGNV